MTYTLIFIFGFVMGMATNGVLGERSVINKDENRQKMMKEIKQEIDNGYMPNLKEYKKKYNL